MNMKKEYKKPEIVIDLLDEKDIVLTSTSVGIGGDELFDFEIDFGEIKF